MEKKLENIIKYVVKIPLYLDLAEYEYGWFSMWFFQLFI